MKNGLSPSSHPSVSLPGHVSPPSFMRLEKNHKSYCLRSSWPGQIWGSFRDSLDSSARKVPRVWGREEEIYRARDLGCSGSSEAVSCLTVMMLIQCCSVPETRQRPGEGETEINRNCESRGQGQCLEGWLSSSMSGSQWNETVEIIRASSDI